MIHHFFTFKPYHVLFWIFKWQIIITIELNEIFSKKIEPIHNELQKILLLHFIQSVGEISES